MVASYPGLPSQLFSTAAKRAVREGLGMRLARQCCGGSSDTSVSQASKPNLSVSVIAGPWNCVVGRDTRLLKA